MSDATMAALRDLAATDLGRGSAALSALVSEGFDGAISSLLAEPALSVVILTGFLIPCEDGGWAGETDGPLGAALLAEALLALGASVRLLTDQPCAAVVRAVAPEGVPIDVAPMVEGSDPCPELIAAYRAAAVTHVISIERVGPGVDGRPRNMRGLDIGGYTACLHHVAEAGPWCLLAVGDGGNEIGMGSLPAGAIAEHVPNGALVRCAVPADQLIVAGTSNWGAAAMVAALALRQRRAELADLLQDEHCRQLMDRLLAAGAVDGVTKSCAASVDGLDWSTYQTVVRQLRELVAGDLAGLDDGVTTSRSSRT